MSRTTMSVILMGMKIDLDTCVGDVHLKPRESTEGTKVVRVLAIQLFLLCSLRLFVATKTTVEYLPCQATVRVVRQRSTATATTMITPIMISWM